MHSSEKMEALTASERILVENYRHIRADKREMFIDMSRSYRRNYPVESPRLQLVPSK